MSLLDGGTGNAGDNGGSGSGGGASGGSGDGGNGGAGAGSGAGAAASWRDSLPQELKDNQMLTAFSDVTNLAKSYIETKSLVGKKGVFVPNEKASDEEWSAFYKQIGQPEMDKFELKAPENADPETLSKFKEFAHASGMTPRQAQKFLDKYLPFEKEMAEKAQQAVQTQMKEQHEALKKEWGQGYDAQLGVAKKAIMEKVSDTTRTWLQESGAHQDPNVMRMAAELAKAVYGEDSVRGEGTGRMGGLTPVEIQRELATIFANPAYFDRNHALHKTTTQRAEELFKMQSPQSA